MWGGRGAIPTHSPNNTDNRFKKQNMYLLHYLLYKVAGVTGTVAKVPMVGNVVELPSRVWKLLCLWVIIYLLIVMVACWHILLVPTHLWFLRPVLALFLCAWTITFTHCTCTECSFSEEPNDENHALCFLVIVLFCLATIFHTSFWFYCLLQCGIAIFIMLDRLPIVI
jgi:hypothetical protein